MTERSVIHDTFSLERTYPAAPSRVFAAFASKEAKDGWGDDPDLGPADDAGANTEFNFRPGGRERFGFKYDGRTLSYDAHYYDIVPDQRIVYSYEMYADGARISVFGRHDRVRQERRGPWLTWTEQGASLDGIDGPQAPASRMQGTAEMLDGLTRYLTTPPAS
jgi:uncharacterized protein YndB with AHSA1/START domain